MFPQAAMFIAESQQDSDAWPTVVIVLAVLAFFAFIHWLDRGKK